MSTKKIQNNLQLGVDKCELFCYYNNITCVRGHCWERQEGEKNVKGLQAGRILTLFPSKKIQQFQEVSVKNAKDTQQRPRQNRCIIATPKQKNAAPPLPNRQIFVPTPRTESPNRQNSNDFRTKKHSKNNDLDVVVNEVSELTQGLVTSSYITA